jgi:hypothetical protein
LDKNRDDMMHDAMKMHKRKGQAKTIGVLAGAVTSAPYE